MKKILLLVIAFVISFSTRATVIVSTVDQLKTAIQNANNGMDSDILIADGKYDLDGAFLLISRAGISVKSQSGNRSSVILDGNYVSNEIFQIIASNVIIADLTLQKAKDHPIHIMGGDNSDVTGVIISNIHIIDPGQQAIKINSRYGYFVNNGIIKDCKIELTESGRNYVWDHNGSCYTGGIDAHSATGWEIRDNEIIGFWCSAGLSEHGIHFWNDSKNTLVERNLIIDCDRGIGFGLNNSAHHGGIIRNNMIYHPKNHGYSDVGIGLESADSVKVYNNTIFLNHSYPNAIEYRFTTTKGGIIKNNLTNKAITSRNGGTADVSNNVTDAVANWFVNTSNGDLHLASALDGLVESGVEIAGLTDDFDKDLRPIGDKIDIGADEYHIIDNSIKVKVKQSDITCFNACDGQITIDTIENAVMPIKYMWSNGDTTSLINELCAGEYTVTITDKNGKTITKTIVLTQPEELLLNIDHTDETANNANDGFISFNPSGGTAPYKIYWNNQIVSGTISNLSPGQFFFKLIDANDCSVTDSVVIEKFICTELVINSKITDASCFGYCDGSISILSIDNSTMPVHYNWDNGDSTSVLSDLCAKDYSIEITDGKNCTVSQSFSITQPDDILITIDSTKDIFTNQSGYIAISSNNTGNYTFSWVGPDGFSVDSEDIFNLNTAGCYTLSIQDTVTMCSKEFEICITDKTATNNLEIGEIYLYPNPAREYIFVDFSESKFADCSATISFFDIAGKKQMQALKNPNENLLKIGTKDLNSKMFIVKIKFSRFGVIYKKVVVNK